jgi:hypothetical protein
MKSLFFIVLILAGCTSFHSSWMTSTYGLTPHNKKQYGYLKSGHEYKPVLNVGDDIYLKFDTPMIQKNDVSNCDNSYESIAVWIWSREDVFLNSEISLFVNKSSIVNIDKVDVWESGEFIALNASNAIKVVGDNSVDDTLVKLWGNNEIRQLLKLKGLNYYNFYLNSPISCSDDFELKLKYKKNQDSLEKVMPTIYFTPTEYQRFDK